MDTDDGLTLLKVDGKFSPLQITPSRSVKFGAPAAPVSFPNIGLQGFAPKPAP